MSTNPSINKIEELLPQEILPVFPAEKVAYINRLCESMGLNPLTRPFEFINFQGKTVLYARKDCTDQLRKIHSVSIKVADQQILADLLTITVEGTDKSGRVDSEIGAIHIGGLKGEALANATMKCLTKAKRRLTLSICGLGILDETELDSANDSVVSTAITADQISSLEALLKTIAGDATSKLLKHVGEKDKVLLTEINQMTSAQAEYAISFIKPYAKEGVLQVEAKV